MRFSTCLLTILLSAFAINTKVLAQDFEPTKHQVALAIGLAQVKEKQLHSKVHTGLQWHGQYLRQYWKKNLMEWQADVAYARLGTGYESPSQSIYLQWRVRGAYLKKIIHTPTFLGLLGGGLSAHYQLAYFPQWDDSHLYWANAWSFQINNHWRIKLANHQFINFKIQLPIITFLSRPQSNRQYKIDDVSPSGIINNMHSRIVFSGWNHSRMAQLEISYPLIGKSKKQGCIGYVLDYAYLGQDQYSTLISLHQRLGLFWNF